MYGPVLSENGGRIEWTENMWQWTEGAERFRPFSSVRFYFEQPKSISCIITSGSQVGFVSEFEIYVTGEDGQNKFIQTIEANSEDELLEKAACLTTPLTTSDLIIEPSGGSNDFFMRFLIYEL